MFVWNVCVASVELTFSLQGRSFIQSEMQHTGTKGIRGGQRFANKFLFTEKLMETLFILSWKSFLLLQNMSEEIQSERIPLQEL